MYRNGLIGNDFDEIENEVFHLYEDLGLTIYPANPFKVAHMLGIELRKYSDAKPEDEEFMVSKYEEGFSIMTNKLKYTIYYNDTLPKCNVWFTIWYEIGHIQRSHLYDNMEASQARMKTECNYFAVVAQAGMPFVFKAHPQCPEDLMNAFGIGWRCANLVFANYVYTRQFPNVCKKILSHECLEKFNMRKIEIT